MSGVREEYLQYALNQPARATDLPGQPASPLPWLEFEIPCPPSVNRFKWRLGNKSPNVQGWIGQADIAWVHTRKNLPRHKCKFEVQFLFGRNSRADFHNFEKPLFDWLQSREFVSNDQLCEWRASGWSDDVPKGRVIVRLRPWMERK